MRTASSSSRSTCSSSRIRAWGSRPASACFSRSGRGSASRPYRTTPRSRRTRRGSCPRDAHLRGRARHRIRHHVAGVRLGVPGERADRDRGRRRQPAVLPGYGAVRQHFPQGPHAGSDPHRLIRLRDGLPQRRHALLLRDGRERVLPRSLGRTHPKYKSPYIASIVQRCSPCCSCWRGASALASASPTHPTPPTSASTR